MKTPIQVADLYKAIVYSDITSVINIMLVNAIPRNTTSESKQTSSFELYFTSSVDKASFVLSIPLRALRKRMGLQLEDISIKVIKHSRTCDDAEILKTKFRIREHVYPCVIATMVSKVIKEELVATAWSPKRVERILNLWGWEALDSMS